LVPGSNNNSGGASEGEGASNLAHASTRVSPFTVSVLSHTFTLSRNCSHWIHSQYNNLSMRKFNSEYNNTIILVTTSSMNW